MEIQYRKVKFTLNIREKPSKNIIKIFDKNKKYIFIILLYFINYSFKIKNKNEYDNNNLINSSIDYNSSINYNFSINCNLSINCIHLAINIDTKYIYPAIVYLTSLLDNRANTTFYFINVLTNGTLEKNSTEKIKSIIDKFGNNSVELIYHNLGNSFNGSTTGIMSLATYYKIALPSLLPNVDKIIYSDTDMINLEDLTEMYNFKFKEKVYFAGILDYINHLNQLREFGLSSDKYINAGLLIMNLKAMREDSIETKLREFISNHTLKFHEQTAINCVCRNNTQKLPYKYNVFAFPQFYSLV